MAADAQHALQKALSEGLASIQRQVGEVQKSCASLQQVLKQASEDRVGELLPSLLQLQTAGAALSASIEAVLRFAGSSMQWARATGDTLGMVAASPLRAAPGVEAAEEVHEVDLDAPVEAPPEPVVEAPAGPQRISEQEIEQLSSDLKDLHKKAKRFAKVTVQELMMYKKDEVEKGRNSKDLYQRLRDEIDKSKAIYDQRFANIAEHNIDYLYDELVRVLANDDPSLLGNYPYPVPSRP